MKINTIASSFFESRSCTVSISSHKLITCPEQRAKKRTETCAHDIILLGSLAHRQVISQTELLITVVAAERLVAVCPLVHIHGVDLSVIPTAKTNRKRRTFGLGRVEGDNRAIGEAGAFAE